MTVQVGDLVVITTDNVDPAIPSPRGCLGLVVQVWDAGQMTFPVEVQVLGPYSSKASTLGFRLSELRRPTPEELDAYKLSQLVGGGL